MCAASRRFLFLPLAVLVFASCARKQEPPPVLRQSDVAILTPLLDTPAAKEGLALLDEWVPAARRTAPEHPAPGLQQALDEQRVLLVPDVEHLPLDGWPALDDFLQRGGAVLFVGRHPFRAGVRALDTGPETAEDRVAKLHRDAIPVEPFSRVQRWEHGNDAGRLKGTVRVVTDKSVPWPSLLVDVVGLEVWDAMISPLLQERAVPDGAQHLVFHARGDAGTTRLALVAEDRSGGRWFADVGLKPDWRPRAVHESEFRRIEPTGGLRASAGGLAWARVRSLHVGLHMKYAPQPAGRHRFGLSEMRFAAGRDAGRPPAALRFAGTADGYEWRAGQAVGLLARRALAFPVQSLQGPRPLPRGTGGGDPGGFRWVPLYQTAAPDGAPRGWPASLFIHETQDGSVRRWGWIGMDFSRAGAGALRAMIADAVDVLRQGRLLISAGCDRFVFSADQPLRVTARWSVPVEATHATRVAAELLDGSGYLVRRVMSESLARDGAAERTGEITLHLGLAPAVPQDAADFSLRVLLESSSGAGRVYDQVVQPIKIAAPRQSPPDTDWIATTGSRFTLRKRPLFLLGVAYAGPTPVAAEGQVHWLDPVAFEPALVQRDLARLEENGVNALAVSYTHPRQAPQLRYVVDEARRRGLRICLETAGLDPLNFQPDEARALLDAIDLANLPEVFALSLSSRMFLGSAPERARWDGEWAAWLEANYGSLQHAETVFGQPLWKKADRVTGPPDDLLTKDGPHRQAVAAYRRFVDDLISRRYGVVRRFLRRAGIPQLISSGTGGGRVEPAAEALFPLDPAVLAAHVDFVTVSAADLYGTRDRLLEGAFFAAYGRGVTDGKPVVFADFSTPLGSDPSSADLDAQAQSHAWMFDTALRSQAAGCFAVAQPDHHAGGRSVLAADGSWRMVGGTFLQFSHDLRRQRTAARVWKGRELDRLAGARGLAAAWEAWRKVYRDEAAANQVEEIRLAGFARATTEVPLTPVGGGPYRPPEPFLCLNAEWGRLVVDGVETVRLPGETVQVLLKQRLDLELLNTGTATWASALEGRDRTVWLRVEHPSRKSQDVTLKTMPFGHAQTVKWIASDLGRWTLRPYLSSVGAFGEALTLDVRPLRPRVAPGSEPNP